MKQLTCEMCGSTELVKQDGFFVCQTCGCKYSVEEAKKMMIEGTVDIQGTVKVDSSDDLKKLYQAARNARETSDDTTALRHYENISAKDPNSWEALFYLVVLKTNSIKNGEIASAAISVSNSIDRVFQLIKEYVSEEADKKAAVKEVIEKCYYTALWLTSASHNFYKTSTKGNGIMAMTGVIGAISSVSSMGSALTEDQNRCFHIANVMLLCGDSIELHFGTEDEEYKEFAVWSWKKMLELNADYKKVHGSNIFNSQALEKYSSKIKQHDADYGVTKVVASTHEVKGENVPNNGGTPSTGKKTPTKRNVISLVFSIVAMYISTIGIMAYGVTGIIGIVFSGIALAKANSTGRFKPISIIALIVSIILTIISFAVCSAIYK